MGKQEILVWERFFVFRIIPQLFSFLFFIFLIFFKIVKQSPSFALHVCSVFGD